MNRSVQRKKKRKRTHTTCIACGEKRPIGGACSNEVPDGHPTPGKKHHPLNSEIPKFIKGLA